MGISILAVACPNKSSMQEIKQVTYRLSISSTPVNTRANNNTLTSNEGDTSLKVSRISPFDNENNNEAKNDHESD